MPYGWGVKLWKVEVNYTLVRFRYSICVGSWQACDCINLMAEWKKKLPRIFAVAQWKWEMMKLISRCMRILGVYNWFCSFFPLFLLYYSDTRPWLLCPLFTSERCKCIPFRLCSISNQFNIRYPLLHHIKLCFTLAAFSNILLLPHTFCYGCYRNTTANDVLFIDCVRCGFCSSLLPSFFRMCVLRFTLV